ncbi:MAG: 50S ribosomal protein L28 [Pseudomonadota bacterium]
MSRRCVVTGKGVQTGNNVSHAMNKTRRRWLPNLQTVAVFSDTLQRSFQLKVSTSGLRTLEHKGGLDAFVTSTAVTKLDPALRPIKKLVEAAKAAS